MNNYYLIVFRNTHDAIESEKILKGEEIKVTIMPTPTYITQSCGISIKFSEEHVHKVKSLIEDSKIKIKNLYYRDNEKFSLIV